MRNKSRKRILHEQRVEIAKLRRMAENIGEFSDGYHTFNELYHHRAVLFSVICNMFPDKAWKAKKHDTGDMYDGMFIVGIETEQGQATYHYDIDPYWDMFKVKELEKAPKYDGHTPSDAIARISNLSCAGYRKQSEPFPQAHENSDKWISVEDRLPEEGKQVLVITPRGLVTVCRYEWRFDKHLGVMLRFHRCDNLKAVRTQYWMPLPEAPKGGEE